MKTDRRSFVIRAAGVGSLLAGGVLGRSAVTSTEGDSPPSALVAGSLQGVAEDIGAMPVEAHGSVAARQLVVDGAREPDALALADPLLFESIADRLTLFATNALVLAYTESSGHAEAIAADWTTAIQDPEIQIGRTDPDLDPLGYRTVMGLRLAHPFGVNPETALDRTLVFPETALMRTLETGELDAAFAYRNMAVEHELPFVELPAAIDFSDPARIDHYADVSYDMDSGTIPGAPIVYGVTALTDRGESWVRSLAMATDRLSRAGFSQPDQYPTRTRYAELDWPE